jgi:hypothetical protein
VLACSSRQPQCCRACRRCSLVFWPIHRSWTRTREGRGAISGESGAAGGEDEETKFHFETFCQTELPVTSRSLRRYSTK